MNGPQHNEKGGTNSILFLKDSAYCIRVNSSNQRISFRMPKNCLPEAWIWGEADLLLGKFYKKEYCTRLRKNKGRFVGMKQGLTN